MMKKCMAIAAAAFLLLTGTAGAAGVLEGTVKAPPDIGLEAIRAGGAGNASGFGVAIGGAKKKLEKSIQLQLISREADFSRLSDGELEAWYKDGVAPANVGVFIERSAEDGTYAFAGIPAGSYYLVIIPPGLGDASARPSSARTVEALSKQLRNWEMYELFTLGMHAYTVQAIELKDNDVTRFDYDFAAPPFSGK